MPIRQLFTTTATAAILGLAGAVAGAPANAHDVQWDTYYFDTETGETVILSQGNEGTSMEEAALPEHVREALEIR